MKAADEFVPLLGPRMGSDSDAILKLAQRWGVDFPEDMVEVLAAYGDSWIADHLCLYGPSTLEKMSTYRSNGWYPPTLDDSDLRPVFPRPGGLLEWAMSSTGDAFCLRQREDSLWTVSTYDQLAFEWTDYEIGLSDWLYAALSSECAFDILPPLGRMRPLAIAPLDVERFLDW